MNAKLPNKPIILLCLYALSICQTTLPALSSWARNALIGEAVAANNTAPTFGSGKIWTRFGSDRNDNADASNIIAQPDGKYIVVGKVFLVSKAIHDFALTRYMPNGTLDTSFGENGRVTTSFGYNVRLKQSIALQADGKIVLAGQIEDPKPKLALARYLPNGMLDKTFGVDGKVVMSIDSIDSSTGSNVTGAMGMAIQPDGKIVVVGTASFRFPPHYDFMLLRFLSNGTLDAGFGQSGIVYTKFDCCRLAGAENIILQPDGKLLAVGWAENGYDSDTGDTTNTAFALVRYLSDGSLDASFGENGLVTADFSANSNDTAESVALQSDGKIVVTGMDRGVNKGPVARFLSNGTLDSGFGNDGWATINFGPNMSAHGKNIIALPNGNLLVSARRFRYPSIDGIGVARLLPDGRLDNQFGSGGVLAIDTGDNYLSYANDYAGMVRGHDGKIILAGSGSNNGLNVSLQMFLARLLPDGRLDRAFYGDQGSLAGFTEVNERGGPDVMAPVAEVYDAELAASGSYDGAILTIGRQGGPNPQDQYQYSASRVVDAGLLTRLVTGAYFAVEGTTIGKVLSNNNGVLQLKFLGEGATQARVNSMLQRITYENTGDNPPPLVKLDWKFEDGNQGAQGPGGSLSTVATVSVKVNPRNNNPEVVNPLTPQIALVGKKFEYFIPANTFFDPDGDALSYSLSMQNGFGVPLWIKINPTTGAMTGTPSGDDVGALELVVNAKDPSGDYASTPLLIEVKSDGDTNPSLSVTKTGSGNGQVQGAGIDCGGDCQETYASGQTVNLVATPDDGSRFTGWGGACGGLGACSFKIASDTTVIASFTSNSTPPPPQPNPSLTVTKTGSGQGTVQGVGIDCGGDCQESFNSGQAISLIATPSPGSSFSGWGGGCSGVGPCSFTIQSDTTVVASFNADNNPNPSPSILASLSSTVVKVKKPVVISWQLHDIAKGMRVRVLFSKDGGPAKVLKSSTASKKGTGKLTWRPTKSQLTTSGSIKVCAVPAKNVAEVCSNNVGVTIN